MIWLFLLIAVPILGIVLNALMFGLFSFVLVVFPFTPAIVTAGGASILGMLLSALPFAFVISFAHDVFVGFSVGVDRTADRAKVRHAYRRFIWVQGAIQFMTLSYLVLTSYSNEQTDYELSAQSVGTILVMQILFALPIMIAGYLKSLVVPLWRFKPSESALYWQSVRERRRKQNR